MIFQYQINFTRILIIHKLVTKEWLTHIKNYNIDNNISFNGILDVGCGSGYATIDNFEYNNWLGLDIDYKKIKQIHNKYANNHKIKYILNDLNNLYNEFNQGDYDKLNYDTLFIINAGHYFQTDVFKKYINQYDLKHIYIIVIDPTYLKSISL